MYSSVHSLSHGYIIPSESKHNHFPKHELKVHTFECSLRTRFTNSSQVVTLILHVLSFIQYLKKLVKYFMYSFGSRDGNPPFTTAPSLNIGLIFILRFIDLKYSYSFIRFFTLF